MVRVFMIWSNQQATHIDIFYSTILSIKNDICFFSPCQQLWCFGDQIIEYLRRHCVLNGRCCGAKNKLNKFLLFLGSQGKNILSNALAWSHTKQVQHRRGISHSYDWQVVLMADQQEFCNPMINISEKSWQLSSPRQHHWFTWKKREMRRTTMSRGLDSKPEVPLNWCFGTSSGQASHQTYNLATSKLWNYISLRKQVMVVCILYRAALVFIFISDTQTW